MKLNTVLVLLLLLIDTPSFALTKPGDVVYGRNGVKYENGIPTCSYGNLRGCGAQAAQNSPTATTYLNQRIEDNPNPNKNTFYNYSPPAKTVVSTPFYNYSPPAKTVVSTHFYNYSLPAKTVVGGSVAPPKRVTCSLAEQKLYGADCR